MIQFEGRSRKIFPLSLVTHETGKAKKNVSEFKYLGAILTIKILFRKKLRAD
jgi:hypothetical protein